MSISDNLEKVPCGGPLPLPDSTQSSKLLDKKVSVQATPAPEIAMAIPPPPAEVPEQKIHEHIFVALQSIFEKKAANSPRESGRLLEAHKKIESFLHQHMDSIIQMAKESESGGISIPKSRTGLPYTLRFFYNKKTEELSFHISFGTFAEGGEAKIKEVYVADKNGVHVQAQRSLREATQKEPEQKRRRLRDQSDKTGEDLLQELTMAEVPGLVTQNLIKYTGKRGIKEPTLSDKQNATLLDYVRNLVTHPPSSKDQKDRVWQRKLRILLNLSHTTVLMHSHGIVHCDIKPENVLLSEKWAPLLGDFGLAVRQNEPIRPRGSVGWLAPEMTYDTILNANPAGDLWSLGSLMFTILFEEQPFIEVQESIVRAESEEERTQKREEFHRLIREKMEYADAHLHPNLARIVCGLLEPDPKKRMTDDELERAWQQK